MYFSRFSTWRLILYLFIFMVLAVVLFYVYLRATRRYATIELLLENNALIWNTDSQNKSNTPTYFGYYDSVFYREIVNEAIILPLSNFPSIKSISIVDCSIGEREILAIGQLHHIARLSLVRCVVSDGAWLALDNVDTMTSLNVYGVLNLDAALKEIPTIGSLQRMSLGCCSTDLSSLRYLSRHPQLMSLELQGVKISINVIKIINEALRLEVLIFRNIQVDQGVIIEMQKLKGVRSIQFFDCQGEGLKDIGGLRKALPECSIEVFSCKVSEAPPAKPSPIGYNDSRWKTRSRVRAGARKVAQRRTSQARPRGH